MVPRVWVDASLDVEERVLVGLVWNECKRPPGTPSYKQIHTHTVSHCSQSPRRKTMCGKMAAGYGVVITGEPPTRLASGRHALDCTVSFRQPMRSRRTVRD